MSIGYSLPNDENKRARFTFTEVEKAYYVEKYSDHVDGQNERNRKARHYDRVKTIDGILENKKTCPEETLLQLGNIDGTVSADVLAQISAEYFEEFNKRYGSHVHILDWALHLDEATPHIHERHVFDAVNKYGELCPQQDKASVFYHMRVRLRLISCQQHQDLQFLRIIDLEAQKRE